MRNVTTLEETGVEPTTIAFAFWPARKATRVYSMGGAAPMRSCGALAFRRRHKSHGF
jgi:hypothetical protein